MVLNHSDSTSRSGLADDRPGRLLAAVFRLHFRPVRFATRHRPTRLTNPESTTALVTTAPPTPTPSSERTL